MTENTQTIKALYEAFGRGDVPHVVAALDAGCVWTEADNFIYADTNPYVGPQAILGGVFARLGSEWDGFTAIPDSFVSEGDTVVTLGHYHGTYKATGVKVNAQYVHVFTVKDGKIMAFQQFTDTAQFRDAASKAA